MPSEPLTAMGRQLSSYEELGARRHHLISERLRERRRTLGLTQKEVVARLRRLGVATSNKALSALEHGAGLDVAKLPEIARALECSLTYLVGLTDDPHSWEPDFRHWPGRRPASPAERPAAATTPATHAATTTPAVPAVARPRRAADAPSVRIPAAGPQAAEQSHTHNDAHSDTACPPILGPLR